MSETNVNYMDLSDEEIIKHIRHNDDAALDYLIRKYKAFVIAKSRPYFLAGADRDDIVQEGMIGLYKAIKDFNYQKHTEFCAFAALCTTRQIITAVKSATRQKHMPLNTYVSFNSLTSNEKIDETILDTLSGTIIATPEQIFIDKENKNYIENHMDALLSKFEGRVLLFYLNGLSYSEIAYNIKCETKSVDNAIQRIRRKVDKIIKQKLDGR